MPVTPPPRKRFTRAEVQSMLDAGLFNGQRFELMDGDLIDKIGQKPPHALAIRILLAWLAEVFGAESVQVQSPIEAGSPDQERSLPEPDLAVLADANADYSQRHPRGDELLHAIEVADSTVRYDATTKRDLYARAGVPEYWVLDIPGRRFIVHRQLTGGRFEEIAAFSDEETIAPAFRPDLSIVVLRCLPKRPVAG